MLRFATCINAVFYFLQIVQFSSYWTKCYIINILHLSFSSRSMRPCCLQLKVLRVYASGDWDCTIFVNILSSVTCTIRVYVCVSCFKLHRKCIFLRSAKQIKLKTMSWMDVVCWMLNGFCLLLLLLVKTHEWICLLY